MYYPLSKTLYPSAKKNWLSNMAKKFIQTLHFKFYMVLKRDLWNPFQDIISFHHNWDCWLDDFKCIPCCCFPTTIYHSLLIWLRELKWEHSFRVFSFLVKNGWILKTKDSFENISPRLDSDFRLVSFFYLLFYVCISTKNLSPIDAKSLLGSGFFSNSSSRSTKGLVQKKKKNT